MYGSQNVLKEANNKKPSNKTDANTGSVSGSSPTFWRTAHIVNIGSSTSKKS